MSARVTTTRSGVLQKFYCGQLGNQVFLEGVPGHYLLCSGSTAWRRIRILPGEMTLKADNNS